MRIFIFVKITFIKNIGDLIKGCLFLLQKDFFNDKEQMIMKELEKNRFGMKTAFNFL